MNQPERTDIEHIQRLLGQRYQLSWIIGRGGMSTVWLAWDTQERRDVAVKILKPEYTDNAEFRSRFRNEAHTSRGFHSPHVVATFDYGEINDETTRATVCYIIMEYIRGESLADVLTRERTLTEKLTLEVMLQVAVGLQTIHSSGMVHRDIKPGNILITPQGEVKITDFGIAKAAAAVPLTQTGMVVGTAQYVSPEQAQGYPVQAASDIYSLGVMAYEMLAGRRPFIGESTVSVAIKHISNPPPPLPEHVRAPVRELIGICLRKDPAARYADGGELAAAVHYVLEGQLPPQPHLVPVVDVDEHLFTEQLAQVATGPGTAVPPRQGPGTAVPPGQEPGTATGVATAASAPHSTGAAGTRRPNSHYPDSQRKATHPTQGRSASANAPLIVLGLVSVLALGTIAYLLLSKEDQPAPTPETFTITNEITTQAPRSSTRTSTFQPPLSFPTFTTQPSPPSTTREAPSSPPRPSTPPEPPSQPSSEPTPTSSARQPTTSTQEDTPTNTNLPAIPGLPIPPPLGGLPPL